MDNNGMTTKQKIKRKAKISVDTTAIGSLASFEHEFGYLWSAGDDYDSLTPEQKKMRERWLEARAEILDRAENSKKLLLREIERADIREPGKFITIIRNKRNYDGE